MKILYIHQYFATPTGKTGTRSYEFSRRWVNSGHKVTVLTSTAQLTGKDLSSAKGRFVKKFSIDGMDIIALNVPYRQQMSTLTRCLAFFSFVVSSSVVQLFVRNVDVIYATSTPLTIGIPAMLLKCLKRIPFVFEVRDQWPKIPVELGVVKNSLLIKTLLWLEKRIYKSASAIVALSPGMAKGVREVVGEDKLIETVPNSSDIDRFRPDIDGANIRKEHGWENKFVLMHFGAMGKVNSLEFLVDVAEKLRDNSDIHFVLIGDGITRQSLFDKVNQLGLQNIELMGSIPKTVLPQYVAACDVSMVIFADFPVLEHNSANKFFDSLSAGKPVLLNYSGWQRKAIEEVNAGFGCSRFDMDEFIEKVLHLSSRPKELESMGKNARILAEKEFNRDLLSSKVLKVLESAVES